MLKKIFRSNFVKNSLTVFTGTLLAQMVGFLVLPITSRLYDESDFGALSLVVSTATVLSSVAALKYEQTILLPKSDFQAYLLVKISLFLSFSLGIFSLILLIFFSDYFSNLLGDSSIKNYLFLIPLLLFFNCFSNINKNYAIRQKKFKLMSYADVFKALVGGVGQVTFGLFNPIAIGLLSGPILSSVAANFYLFKKLNSVSFKNILSFKRERRMIKILLKRYNDFPVYNVPATMANNLVLYGQNILIFGIFTASDLGQLSMAQKLLAVPTALIGSAIANVYLGKLKDDKEIEGKIKKTFIKTFLLLTSFSVPFVVLGYFLFPVLIPLILGDKWAFAGELAIYLVFLYSIRLIVFPLSGLVIILEKQKQYLYLIFFQLSLIVLTFIIVDKYNLDIIMYVKIYVASQILFYFIFLIYLHHISKRYDN